MGLHGQEFCTIPSFPAMYVYRYHCHVYVFCMCTYMYIDCVLMIFTSVLYTFYRVWRYRGGRDGHETLQQFMNFLGRGKEVQLESGTQQGQSHCTTAGRI